MMIEEDIRLRYFCPVISEILSIKDKMGSFYFDVVIRGRKKNFMVRDLSKNIRQLNATVTITDTDGNRYKIEDIGRSTERADENWNRICIKGSEMSWRLACRLAAVR